MSTIRPTTVMDITSKGEYPSGKLSNFAPHAFVFDGVACASMEGLLQSLKFEDESVQQHICTLAGKAAKKAGSEKNWKRDHTLWWKGRPINRLSRQYQEFLDDAFAALSSNDSFKRALLATGEATLTHSIGEPEPQDTVLTEREFCSRLTAIRARLVIKPRAWIGCLTCYNHGDLVGNWFPATKAAGATIAGVHADHDVNHRIRGCDELWVFDHEHIPVRGEMDPLRAAEWGARITEVPAEQRAAFIAWARTDHRVLDAENLPVISAFNERYCGTWETFLEYAEHLVEKLGVLDGASDEARRYFDYDAYAHDISYDYTTIACDDGDGIHIFRDI